MGVGKTERLGTNTSRFAKGRRIDATNDRIMRNLKVHGGRIHKRGDKWVIDVSQDVGGGEVNPSTPAFVERVGDADVADSDRSSIQKRDIGSVGAYEIHNFNEPGDVAISDPSSAEWTTEKDRQKLAFRKEDADGNATLEFGKFNPLPSGSTLGDVVEWSQELGGWVPKSPPFDGRSLELKLVDGVPVWQIVGFDSDNTTSKGISEVLVADPETGEITASGGSQYELIARVGGANGTIGFMPIGDGDGEDPSTTENDGCQHEDFPGSGGDDPGGGGGDEGGDRSLPGGGSGQGGSDRNDDDFPGKTGACW